MTSLDDKVKALLERQGLTDTATAAGAAAAPEKQKKPAAKKRAKRIVPKKVATRPNKAAEKAELFAHAYVRTGCNATAAYREAISPNCKDNTAQVEGHKYLSKPMVQQVLAPLLEGLMQKNEVDTEFVISRLLEQANASPLDYFHVDDRGQIVGIDLTGVTEGQRRNLKSIRMTENTFTDKSGNDHTTRSWVITVVDQQKAVEMFARYLKMFSTLEEDAVDAYRIGDRLAEGVKRIRASRDLDAWKDDAIDAKFSEVG